MKSRTNHRSEMDWTLIDHVDPLSLKTDHGLPTMRLICRQFLEATTVPLDQPTRVLKLFQILQVIVGYFCTSQDTLNQKVEELTSGQREVVSVVGLQCPICMKVFESLTFLDKHIFNRHGEVAHFWQNFRTPPLPVVGPDPVQPRGHSEEQFHWLFEKIRKEMKKERRERTKELNSLIKRKVSKVENKIENLQTTLKDPLAHTQPVVQYVPQPMIAAPVDPMMDVKKQAPKKRRRRSMRRNEIETSPFRLPETARSQTRPPLVIDRVAPALSIVYEEEEEEPVVRPSRPIPVITKTTEPEETKEKHRKRKKQHSGVKEEPRKTDETPKKREKDAKKKETEPKRKEEEPKKTEKAPKKKEKEPKKTEKEQKKTEKEQKKTEKEQKKTGEEQKPAQKQLPVVQVERSIVKPKTPIKIPEEKPKQSPAKVAEERPKLKYQTQAPAPIDVSKAATARQIDFDEYNESENSSEEVIRVSKPSLVARTDYHVTQQPVKVTRVSTSQTRPFGLVDSETSQTMATSPMASPSPTVKKSQFQPLPIPSKSNRPPERPHTSMDSNVLVTTDAISSEEPATPVQVSINIARYSPAPCMYSVASISSDTGSPRSPRSSRTRSTIVVPADELIVSESLSN